MCFYFKSIHISRFTKVRIIFHKKSIESDKKSVSSFPEKINHKMKLRTSLILACAALLLAVSCKNTPSKKTVLTQEETDAIEAQLSQMTLREKVGQLFTVRPEAMCPELEASGQGMYTYKLQTVTEGMVERSQVYPVGGYTLFAHNIDNPEQLKSFTAALHALPGEPLLSVDEEGGRVARIANNDHFDVPRYASMAAVGATGDPANAHESGKAIGTYLKEYGFDIDFAPDADVNTNPENVVIGDRAFSNDPKVAAPMVVSYMEGLEEAGVVGCLKHFPGHGDTRGDTHTGYVQSDKNWKQMSACEMVTFKAGARMIMTAHIAAPEVTGSELPSTLSPIILQDKLRKELGYTGIIITDALGMGAISQHYTSAEAAVKCIEAGADILLMPQSLPEAFEAVVAAVEDGTIPQARIDESVRRILTLKYSLKK